MKIFKALASLAALLALAACVTAPTDPAMLAAWNAEKAARTEARRPDPGSVLPKGAKPSQDFEGVKENFEASGPEDIWQ
jgi:hypothetical protein